jgi:hypothetical protein
MSVTAIKTAEFLNAGNKAQWRFVLWVGSPADKIEAVNQIASNGVKVAQVSAADLNEVIPLFEGTATIQNFCVVLSGGDVGLLVR